MDNTLLNGDSAEARQKADKAELLILVIIKKLYTIKKPSNSAIIAVLEKTGGLLKPAAQKLKVERATLYNWIKAEPELQTALESIKESMIDMTEGALFRQIQEGNTTAMLFYLKTQGKKRGYIEKSETDITSNGQTILIKLPEVNE